jgi:DNA primase
VRLVADVERVSFAEAKGLVHFNRHTQISVAKPVHAIFSGYSYLKLPERSTEDPATVKLPSGYVPVNRDSVAQRRAWMYLDERGVTDELAKAFEVGFCLRGEYAFRLILPIRFHGEVVGFTARTVVDAKPKFRFPPGFPASEYLYNYDNAAASKLVIIVEGAFDSWRMPLSAVGLFSKNMSQKQKELIASTWRHAVVMLDRDAGREAVDVAAQLRPHLETVRVALLHDKDPWEAAPMELARAIKNSTSTGLEVLCSNIGN